MKVKYKFYTNENMKISLYFTIKTKYQNGKMLVLP